MLSFTSSLSQDTDGIAIFVNEKYGYRDNKGILSKNAVQKINSFLSVLKAKKVEEEVSSLDISEKQKCFVIKVKNKYSSYSPQESGGSFFSYLKRLLYHHAMALNILL